jgi:methionine aminopeptidase
MKFAVVSFIKEKGAVFVVPTSWLVNDNVCHWPPYATDVRVQKAVKNGEVVADTWAKHDIRVMIEAGYYVL